MLPQFGSPVQPSPLFGPRPPMFNPALFAGMGKQAAPYNFLPFLQGGQGQANYPNFSAGTPTPGAGVGGPMAPDENTNPTGLPEGQMIQPQGPWGSADNNNLHTTVNLSKQMPNLTQLRNALTKFHAAQFTARMSKHASTHQAHANNTPY